MWYLWMVCLIVSFPDISLLSYFVPHYSTFLLYIKFKILKIDFIKMQNILETFKINLIFKAFLTVLL